MTFAELPGDTSVGQEVVEVVHQVGPGHDRETLDVSLGQPAEVDAS